MLAGCLGLWQGPRVMPRGAGGGDRPPSPPWSCVSRGCQEVTPSRTAGSGVAGWELRLCELGKVEA